MTDPFCTCLLIRSHAIAPNGEIQKYPKCLSCRATLAQNGQWVVTKPGSHEYDEILLSKRTRTDDPHPSKRRFLYIPEVDD